jgi:predicted peptidase
VRLPVLLGLSFLLAAPPPGDETGRIVPHEVRLPSGATARYAVWLPPGFTPERYWPAVVFLHGKQESGTDNERQTQVGLGPALRQRPGGWPAVVVFPQKPEADVPWSDRVDLVLTVLAGARASYPIDTRRIYLTGISQGGQGTWAIAAEHPGTFAAIVPIAGWSEAPEAVARGLGATPVWLFHGLEDTEVSPRAAQKIAAALQKEGHPPRLTLFGKTGHNAWDRAYRQRSLPRWLFRKRAPLTSPAISGKPETGNGC